VEFAASSCLVSRLSAVQFNINSQQETADQASELKKAA
jgi:hypothetical protein